MFGNRTFSNGFAANRSVVVGNHFAVSNARFWFHGGSHWGCWNCGFAWGFGFGAWPAWGFGWPWYGYAYWPPFYWNSFAWGWPGYGYYGYPAGYPYTYNSNDSGNDSSYSASPSNYVNAETTSSPSSEHPVEQTSTQTYSVGNGAVPVLIYLKNGSVFSVRDYWYSGDQVHYVLLNGNVGVFNSSELDLRRTIDENARSGVKVVVNPDGNTAEPKDATTPAAQ